MLQFTASWCGICKTEMPDFEQAYKTYGEDINFLMVNVTDGSKETLKSAKDFLSNESYTFPVYFDTGMIASISYGVTGLPTTYFFDADGNAVWFIGSNNETHSGQKKNVESFSVYTSWLGRADTVKSEKDEKIKIELLERIRKLRIGE